MLIMPWIYAARPKTLIASIAPILCSIIILPSSAIINLWILLLVFISALFIQIGTNYINDLYDYLKGSDNENRIGPERMVLSGKIKISNMKVGIKFSFIISSLAGLPLVYYGGFPILMIGISGLFCAYLYTAGPIPIAYTATGEIFVLLYFGVFAVSGSYYLQTGNFNLLSILTGLSIGSLNVILLLINNIRDYDNDKNCNKKTMVVLMGVFFGRIEVLIMFLISYISIFIIAYKFSTLFLFYIYLLSIPLSLNILHDVIFKTGQALNKTIAKVALLMIAHCFLIFIGFS